jgi:hypothetical protein
MYLSQSKTERPKNCPRPEPSSKALTRTSSCIRAMSSASQKRMLLKYFKIVCVEVIFFNPENSRSSGKLELSRKRRDSANIVTSHHKKPIATIIKQQVALTNLSTPYNHLDHAQLQKWNAILPPRRDAAESAFPLQLPRYYGSECTPSQRVSVVQTATANDKSRFGVAPGGGLATMWGNIWIYGQWWWSQLLMTSVLLLRNFQYCCELWLMYGVEPFQDTSEEATR